MSLNVSTKPKYPRVGNGTYPARPVRVIGLGRQVQTEYPSGEVKTYPDGNPVVKPEVWIDFELPTETIDVDGEEKPRWLGKVYVISNHEKSGMFALMSATGCDTQKGAVSDILTKPLSLTVGETSGGKDKITGTTPLMKGFVVPELKNKTVVFDPEEPDMDVFMSLPQFLKDKIKAAEDYSGFAEGDKAKAFADTDNGFDDAPFDVLPEI